ncbi:MAG: hypothetical protein KGL18_03035 [Burkholderiales bacterium]|nr:hypothetical protein [Burkholderiales bacterium]MDE1928097.1 hypothetical protein [Burkholderiales bacterium]MDE2501940.1 hypothetical protein [Burkholderiales bacterium]
MTSTQSRSTFGRRMKDLALGLALAGGLVAAAAAKPPAMEQDGGLLALGDSIVYGFIDGDGYAYGNPGNFIGYPEFLERQIGLRATNASCPGETAAGFVSWTGADNGCRPFRASFPLHVPYGATQTQLDWATTYLSTHKNTRLVTIGLGANDGFLLQAACQGDTTCIMNGLPATLASIYANMNTILANLKATGFKGILMVVNYYSLDYSDPVQTGFSMALNSTLAAVAAANGAVVADVFSAFQQVAVAAGGKTCMTGLLNGANPQNAAPPFACDVHPSLSGQRLLAKVVAATFVQAGGHPRD